ncbi:MAG: hypothetical protein KA293_09220 [Bacteroidia bacterium]|nr:hypothetical protein [Bacteroidia bacterium]
MKKKISFIVLLGLCFGCGYAQSIEPNLPQLGERGTTTPAVVKPTAVDRQVAQPTLGNAAQSQKIKQLPTPTPDGNQRNKAPQLMESSPAKVPEN